MLLIIPAMDFDCIIIHIIEHAPILGRLLICACCCGSLSRSSILTSLGGLIFTTAQLGADLHKTLLVNALVEHHLLVLQIREIIRVYAQLK
jgi:hypothetical protein